MSNVIVHALDCDCPTIVLDREEQAGQTLADNVMEVVGR